MPLTWTPADMCRLIDLAGQGLCAFQIAPLLGRQPRAVRGKAARMGIELARYNPPKPPAKQFANGDWSAERIAACADVPLDLARLVILGAKQFGIPVEALRSAARGMQFVKCRNWIARIAVKRCHSYSSIGRALNRDHTTIMYAVGALKKSNTKRLSPQFTGFAVCSPGDAARIAA